MQGVAAPQRFSAPALPELGTAWSRPPSVGEACALLGELGGAGRPVAGCTALTPLALAADRDLRVAVDLTALPELGGIEQRPGELRVGAMVTAQALAAGEAVREHAPMLAAAAAGIGDEVLRGMATIGGNLAIRTPAPLELPVAVAALGASIELASSRGARTIDAAELSDPDLRLAGDELITRITVPAAGEGDRWSYRKLTTNMSSYGVAWLALRAPAGGRPSAFAGLGAPFPQRLAAAEEWLAGGARRGDPRQVAAEACEGLVGTTDPLASASYRRRGLEALLAEELRTLAGGGGEP